MFIDSCGTKSTHVRRAPPSVRRAMSVGEDSRFQRTWPSYGGRAPLTSGSINMALLAEGEAGIRACLNRARKR